jgi:hypothetical protein
METGAHALLISVHRDQEQTDWDLDPEEWNLTRSHWKTRKGKN